jgi:hypothetical protein
MSHNVYTTEEVLAVRETHREPETAGDKAAFVVLRAIRTAFDTATGYGRNMTTSKYLTRMIVLETVAGIPGMVGGMLRHLHSLRTMRRDHG